MKELPQFLKVALEKFHDGDPEHLVRIFKNRVQLNQYKETSDLIENLLLGKPVRSPGRPSRKQKYNELSVLSLVAQLKGAGFAVYSHTLSGKKTACEIAGDNYNLNPATIYKNIWLPEKDSDFVLKNIKFGEENAEQYQSGFS